MKYDIDTQNSKCIPLGTYGLDVAHMIRDRFNREKKRNNVVSKDWYIKFRARGNRHGKMCYKDFMPLKYAQRIAVYLEYKKLVKVPESYDEEQMRSIEERINSYKGV